MRREVRVRSKSGVGDGRVQSRLGGDDIGKRGAMTHLYSVLFCRKNCDPALYYFSLSIRRKVHVIVFAQRGRIGAKCWMTNTLGRAGSPDPD